MSFSASAIAVLSAVRPKITPPHGSVLLVVAQGIDNAVLVAAMADYRARGSDVVHIEFGLAALDWLGASSTHGPDRQVQCHAIVLDLTSPCSDLQTLAKLRNAAPEVPILVLCTQWNEALGLRSVRNGAQDYLLIEHLDGKQLGKALDCMLQRSAVAAGLASRNQAARLTLDAIGDAVICSDLHGQVTYVNEVAADMIGWAREELIGRPVGEALTLVDARSHAAVANPLVVALRETRAVKLAPHSMLIGRHGREVYVEDSTALIRDAGGRVSGAVMVFRNVSEARKQARQAEFLALHDSLTDLPNRASLQDRLARCLAAASGVQGEKVALLFVDLDCFKAVNDSLGHAMGDLLLKSVARRLLACVRSTDIVARQGGDEFVILLPALRHAHDATAIAEKILRALRAPHRLRGHIVRVTGSIGIALYPHHGADAATLIDSADLAMYQVKTAGRNSYRLSAPAASAPAAMWHAADNVRMHG